MVRILCNNKAGLNSQTKLSYALRQARNFDLCLYQETKLRKCKINEIRTKWGSPDVFMASSQGQFARRGVLTLFSPRIQLQHLECKEDPEGQFLINLVVYHTTIIMIVNFYGDPDTDQNAALTLQRLDNTITTLMQNYQIGEIICGGDFNFVLDDRDTNLGTRKPNAEALWRTIIANLQIFDIEALLTQDPRRTYFRHHLDHRNARYDRFYISRGLLTGAKLNVLPRTGDHSPLELIVLEADTGHKQWRMDDRILDSANGLEVIHIAVRDTLKESVADPTDQIDVTQLQYFVDFNRECPLSLLTKVITRIRNKLKEVTSARKALINRTEKQLIEDLIIARDQHSALHTPESLEAYEDARSKLHLSQSENASKAADKNFLRYARGGERVTHYHFSLMNRSRAARTIRELQLPDVQAPNQTRTIDGYEIVQHMAQKFSEIAREEPNIPSMSIREFLGQDLADSAEKCPDHMFDMLEEDICAEQLKSVIKGMKNMSSPGPLGITNRLLKSLFPLIQEILVKAGNRLLFSDTPHALPRWLFHRKVVFIPKPGKSPTSDDSYRGLSMLENIFKMYSTVLAQRMAKALKLIQDPEQYGFTEGKSCMEPTRTVIDTLRHANQNNQPLIILSTDLYKAFDTISLIHIERSLEFFEFPPEYRKAFMKLARNGTLQFEINGHLSDDFELNRGTGQGDPKSSFCFNLCITPLNIYLSKSPEVPRYRIGEVEISPVYFADDNACILDGADSQPILRTVEKIQAFKQVSGLDLNLTKCEFMAVNCPQNTINELSRTGMKQVPRLKHLGVIIEQSGEVLEEHNFEQIIERMEAIGDRFATSASTPIGRALFAKFLLGSLYVHRFQNGSLSEQTIQNMTEAMLYMTWTRARMTEEQTGYRVHIAKSRVMQPPSYGGLYLPSPGIQDTTLRMLWLRRFNEGFRTQGWYKLLSIELERTGRPSIPTHMKLGTKEWRKTAGKLVARSPYWANVFRAGARIQELAIKQHKLWHMIPVFGSSEGDDAVTLISLEHENPIVRPLIDSQLVVIGQLFKVRPTGHIDPTAMKTQDEIGQQFRNVNDNLWLSMVGLVNSVKRRFRQTINTESVIQTNQTALASIVGQYAKGCSAANSLLLRAEREQWPQGEVPPSHRTYTRDGITQMNENSFMAAFTSVYKSELLPSFKWTSLQILLRTLWTKVKESRSRGGDDLCVNCGQQPEHTIHMMHQCNLATGVLQKLEASLGDSLDDDVPLTSDAVLFHHLPNSLNKHEKKNVIDILMIYKHTIYKLRFRENIARYPTIKLVLISIILELNKLISLKNKNGEATDTLELVNLKLKQEINWAT